MPPKSPAATRRMRARAASEKGSVRNDSSRTRVSVLQPLISTRAASMPSADVPLISPMARRGLASSWKRARFIKISSFIWPALGLTKMK